MTKIFILFLLLVLCWHSLMSGLNSPQDSIATIGNGYTNFETPVFIPINEIKQHWLTNWDITCYCHFWTSRAPSTSRGGRMHNWNGELSWWNMTIIEPRERPKHVHSFQFGTHSLEPCDGRLLRQLEKLLKIQPTTYADDQVILNPAAAGRGAAAMAVLESWGTNWCLRGKDSVAEGRNEYAQRAAIWDFNAIWSTWQSHSRGISELAETASRAKWHFHELIRGMGIPGSKLRNII